MIFEFQNPLRFLVEIESCCLLLSKGKFKGQKLKDISPLMDKVSVSNLMLNAKSVKINIYFVYISSELECQLVFLSLKNLVFIAGDFFPHKKILDSNGVNILLITTID